MGQGLSSLEKGPAERDMQPPSRRTLFPDTHPEAEAALIRLLRQAPPWRKLHLVGQLGRTVRLLALGGLRRRHPQATPQGRPACSSARTWPAALTARWEPRSRPMLPEPIAAPLLVNVPPVSLALRLVKQERFRLGDETSERQWHDLWGVLRVQGGRLDRACLRYRAAVGDVAGRLGQAWKIVARGEEP